MHVYLCVYVRACVRLWTSSISPEHSSCAQAESGKVADSLGQVSRAHLHLV